MGHLWQPSITAFNTSGVTGIPLIPQFPWSASSMIHEVGGTIFSFGNGRASISATMLMITAGIRLKTASWASRTQSFQLPLGGEQVVPQGFPAAVQLANITP